mmetsp:Transcript_7106/g.12963  ORF Transcript_7106/g.12963 Transcript_7106/m.12963 type:complete len:133 (+) Transcript_7106:84-482(+)
MSAAGGSPLACSQDLKVSADRLPAPAMATFGAGPPCAVVMGEVLTILPAGADQAWQGEMRRIAQGPLGAAGVPGIQVDDRPAHMFAWGRGIPQHAGNTASWDALDIDCGAGIRADASLPVLAGWPGPAFVFA